MELDRPEEMLKALENAALPILLHSQHVSKHATSFDDVNGFTIAALALARAGKSIVDDQRTCSIGMAREAQEQARTALHIAKEIVEMAEILQRGQKLPAFVEPALELDCCPETNTCSIAMSGPSFGETIGVDVHKRQIDAVLMKAVSEQSANACLTAAHRTWTNEMRGFFERICQEEACPSYLPLVSRFLDLFFDEFFRHSPEALNLQSIALKAFSRL